MEILLLRKYISGKKAGAGKRKKINVSETKKSGI